MRILMSVTTWDGARVEAGLREFGFLSTVARDGIEVFECLDLLNHPVVLLETDLPDMNWRVAMTQLRAEHPNLTIIAIDNNGKVEDTLAALEAGADDVIDPKMRADEMVSRVLSVTARRAGFSGPVLRIGALKVDLRTRSIFWGPTQIDISPSQYEIFEMLCLNRTSAITKEHVMGQLYGVDDGPDPRVIDVFVCKLRARMTAAGAPTDLIETIRGRGFRLSMADTDRGRKPLPYVTPVVPIEFPKAA